jgi:hypothetical protein
MARVRAVVAGVITKMPRQNVRLVEEPRDGGIVREELSIKVTRVPSDQDIAVIENDRPDCQRD